MLTWLGGLLLGYALVYLQYVDAGLSYDPSVTFGSRGPVEALYMSGVSLTTVGFGDVVATTDVLRLVTVTEAAGGFAVITGAISYLITVYPGVAVSVCTRQDQDGQQHEAHGQAVVRARLELKRAPQPAREIALGHAALDDATTRRRDRSA